MAIIKNNISDTNSRVSNNLRMFFFARIIPNVTLKVRNARTNNDQVMLPVKLMNKHLCHISNLYI